MDGEAFTAAVLFTILAGLIGGVSIAVEPRGLLLAALVTWLACGAWHATWNPRDPDDPGGPLTPA